MSTTYSTREEWLTAAIADLAPRFAEIDVALPTVRVSVGWPGGRGRKNKAIGQCCAAAQSADDVSEIFISPTLDDTARILDVLLHELVHAADDCKSGHKAPFARVAKALGLEGKMTATTASADLAAELATLASGLGAYPHAALSAGEGAETPKTQSTRMLKAECGEGSGYVVRLTRKWLDAYGAPECPCHHLPMVEA